MSKRRRDRGESRDDLLNDFVSNDLGEPGDESLTTFANAAYGSRVGDQTFAEVGRNRIKVVLLPIETIYPDFAQPRRAIPSTIRNYWTGNTDAESINQMFTLWLREVQIERKGVALDLYGYLVGEVTDRAPAQLEENLSQVTTKLGTLEAALLRVVVLAASIRRDGLTNPITVVQRNDIYVIETGERRWLAYQLLRWFFAEQTEWMRIPARVMEKASIWRQATENNVRADLNAIARARQLALIVMELYREQGKSFRPFEIYKHEQAFYAQVQDPIQHKVPYGKGELVLNAMGFENKSTIKRYRDLLSLPPDIWTLADDMNIPESVLRQMVNKPVEQQMGLYNMWLETGRLHPEDRQGMLVPDRKNIQFGKFGRLMEYEFQQWQGEFDELDEDAQSAVVAFLKQLLAGISRQ